MRQMTTTQFANVKSVLTMLLAPETTAQKQKHMRVDLEYSHHLLLHEQLYIH